MENVGVYLKKYWWIVVLVVLVILAFCIWSFGFNPYDELGRKCQTFYNQSSYQLVDGPEISIPSNSCFVEDCCSHVASFRTTMKYDELETYLENLEQEMEKEYPNLTFEATAGEGNLFFRTYSIYYH